MTTTDVQVRKLMEEHQKHGQVGRAALRAGMHRNTASKYLKAGELPSTMRKRRDWRTRRDPFAEDWAEIAARLEDAPDLQAAATRREVDRVSGQAQAALSARDRVEMELEALNRIKGLNHPLRGWKTQVYEGGIRVPAFVHWPGRLTPGKVSTPVHVIDWMPTLCALLDIREPAGANWDGVNVWSTLNAKTNQLNMGMI